MNNILSGLFGAMKPDPSWIYYNTGLPCGLICDKNGKVINFDILGKRKPVKGFGYFVYVIRELEPKRIYIYHFHKIKSEKDFSNVSNFTEFDCKTKKDKIVNHNCLGLDRRVICAGEITFYPNTRDVKISNASGHYFPKEESLQYTIYLLNNLNYKVKEIDLF